MKLISENLGGTPLISGPFIGGSESVKIWGWGNPNCSNSKVLYKLLRIDEFN